MNRRQSPPSLAYCFSSVFTERTPHPGAPLLPASGHPPTSFPGTTSGTTSAILSLQYQPTLFFYLNSLSPTNNELPNLSEFSHPGE